MDVLGASVIPVSRARCVPVRVARSAARRGAAVTCCRGEGEVRAAARPRAGVWRSENARAAFICVCACVCVLAPGQRLFRAVFVCNLFHLRDVGCRRLWRYTRVVCRRPIPHPDGLGFMDVESAAALRAELATAPSVGTPARLHAVLRVQLCLRLWVWRLR